VYLEISSVAVSNSAVFYWPQWQRSLQHRHI